VIAVFQNVQITLIFLFSIFAIIFLYAPFKEYLPVILFLVIWYVPGQTAPHGLFENYQILKWVSHILIPFTAAVYFTRDIARKIKWDLSPFLLPMICLFFLICVSAIYNQSNILDFASCISIYLRYPLLFLLLINWDIKDSSIEKVIPCFFVLLLAQIPESLFRALVWGIRGDAISYTLGRFGSFPLGIYCLYAIAFLTAQATVTGLKWYQLALTIVFILIGGLGEIKALFIFTGPVIFLTVLFCRVKTNTIISRIIPITAIVALALYFVFENWETLTGGGRNLLGNIVLYVRLLFEGRSSYELPYITRVDQINIIANMLMSSPANLFVGFGPGSSLAGNFSGSPGVVAATMSRLIWAGILIIQYVAVVGDLGLIGLILFGFLFFRIFVFILRYRNILSDPKYKIYTGAFIGIFAFYTILGPFYNVVWRYDGSNFIMWVLLAILYRKYRNVEAKYVST